MNRIRSLLRWALVERKGDDTADMPSQRITYMGKQGTAIAWFPYGWHANLPAGTLGALLSMGGLPEGRIILGGSPYSRGDEVGALDSGEVLAYHPRSGSYLHFKTGGHIDMILPNANADLWVQAAGEGVFTSYETLVGAQTTVTVLGWTGVSLVAGAPIVIQGTVCDVNCANSDFSGNVKINGNLEVVGTTTLGATVTSNGTDVSDTHTHSSAVGDGGSSTGAPN